MWLNEVSFMRPFLLLLLVSYHAFAPFCGSWSMPEGIHDFESYRWIALFSRAFRLEAFVFISGYIFTFQLLTKDKFASLSDLAIKKAKRLIIPCVVFGALYYILFNDVSSLGSPIRILTGIAHLWYLPCLFWLFIIHYVVIKRLKIKYLIGGGLIVVALQSLSILPIPFQLNKVCYYYLFFYMGGLFYQKSEWIKQFTSIYKTIVVCGFFLLLVYLCNVIMERNLILTGGTQSMMMKLILIEINTYLKSGLAIVGITAFYMIAVLYCRNHSISPLLLKIGTCGYGVYIFHQFILVYIYRLTSLPMMLGTYWLPWFGFLVSVVGSLILTILLRKTHIGKQYL